MNDALWTVVLVGISCVGLYIAPRRWWGWAILAASEFLWLAYAIQLHSTSLKIMSGIWFILNVRGARITRKEQRDH